MNLMTLAYRNLFRYKRRTLVTASALAYGILVFVYVDSFMSGMNEETYRNARAHETGDGKVLAAGWWEHREEISLEYLIQNPQQVSPLLTDFTFTPHVDFPGEILFYKSNGFVEDGSLPVVVRALDPRTAPAVFQQLNKINQGGLFQPQDRKILLGSWFAQKLKAAPGKALLLKIETRHGMIDVVELEVSGIIHTKDNMINRNAVYIPLDLAQEALELKGALTGFTLLGNPKEVALLGEKMPRRLEVLTFRDLMEEYDSLMEISDGVLQVILLLIVLIAAVGVTNTMMIGIFERKREVGMLRSLGMEDKDLLAMFIWEAVFIGVTGVVIGIILSLPINYFMVYYGLDYTFMFDEMDFLYRTTGYIRSVWKPLSYMYAALMGMVIAGLMAIVPARRILKKSIPDNLRIK